MTLRKSSPGHNLDGLQISNAGRRALSRLYLKLFEQSGQLQRWPDGAVSQERRCDIRFPGARPAANADAVLALRPALALRTFLPGDAALTLARDHLPSVTGTGAGIVSL